MEQETINFYELTFGEQCATLATVLAERLYEAETAEERENASKQLDRLYQVMVKEHELELKDREITLKEQQDAFDAEIKSIEIRNSWMKSLIEGIATGIKGLSFGWLIGKVIDAEKDGYIRSTAFRLVSGLFRFKG